MDNRFRSIFRYFPELIEKKLIEELQEKYESLEEIRIRTFRPIILKLRDTEKVIKHDVSQEDVLNIMQKICENSIYSYQNEISAGFVTIKGGHRIRNKRIMCFRK